jgi:type II secretory pathway pseudopilin PulG
MKNRGVTLIEVIIIIGIIAILAGALAPLVYKTTETARYKRAQKELESIYKAVIGNSSDYFGYIGDMGKFPDPITQLYIKSTQPNPVENPAGSGIFAGWRGPYISPTNSDTTGIKDPWGNYYLQVFNAWGNNNKWMLVCAGKDGQFDNTNQNASVNNDNLYYPDEPIQVSSYTNGGGNTIYTIFNSVSVNISLSNNSIKPLRVRFSLFDVREGVQNIVYGIGNQGVFNNITIGNKAIDTNFILDDGTIINSPSVRKFINLQQYNPQTATIQINNSPETLCVLTATYGGCGLSSVFTLDSTFDRANNLCSGSDLNNLPYFSVYFEGYNASGEKIWGPIEMTRYSSSPHFRFQTTNSPCGIRTVRFFSTGGGATIIRNF